jgi:prepilin peptidase CpaA
VQLSNPPPAAAAALLTVVITAAVFDLRTRRIPNWVSAAGALLGIGLNTFLRNGAAGAWFALEGLLAGFAVYFVLYLIRAMGAADVKLMGAVGAIVGWQNWVGLFIVTSIAGGILALAAAAAKGRLRKTLFNAGFILSELRHGRPAYLASEELDVRSDKAFRLPHCFTIAAGSILFLAISARFTR